MHRYDYMEGWTYDVLIGMALLDTDQEDGVHRTPVGGDQKTDVNTPSGQSSSYTLLLVYILLIYYSLRSYFTFSSSSFSSVFPSAAILWVYSYTLTGYLYDFSLVSLAQPSQITPLQRNASPCQVTMNARQPVENRQSMDNRVGTVGRTYAVHGTPHSKFELSGFTAVSKRCHELAAGTRQFWKLKQEIADLMLIDLGPHLKELFPVTANNIQNELVESLKEEFLVGIFPTGAKWAEWKINRYSDETRLPSLRMNLVGSIVTFSQSSVAARIWTWTFWVQWLKMRWNAVADVSSVGRESGRSRSRRSWGPS